MTLQAYSFKVLKPGPTPGRRRQPGMRLRSGLPRVPIASLFQLLRRRLRIRPRVYSTSRLRFQGSGHPPSAACSSRQHGCRDDIKLGATVCPIRIARAFAGDRESSEHVFFSNDLRKFDRYIRRACRRRWPRRQEQFDRAANARSAQSTGRSKARWRRSTPPSVRAIVGSRSL